MSKLNNLDLLVVRSSLGLSTKEAATYIGKCSLADWADYEFFDTRVPDDVCNSIQTLNQIKQKLKSILLDRMVQNDTKVLPYYHSLSEFRSRYDGAGIVSLRIFQSLIQEVYVSNFDNLSLCHNPTQCEDKFFEFSEILQCDLALSDTGNTH